MFVRSLYHNTQIQIQLFCIVSYWNWWQFSITKSLMRWERALTNSLNFSVNLKKKSSTCKRDFCNRFNSANIAGIWFQSWKREFVTIVLKFFSAKSTDDLRPYCLLTLQLLWRSHSTDTELTHQPPIISWIYWTIS